MDIIGPESVALLQTGFERQLGSKSRRLYLALYDLLATGQLPVESRLPASRALAQSLGIGRNTVTETYQQLVDEGLLYTARRGGTRVRAPIRVSSGDNTQTTACVKTALPVLSSRGAERALRSRPLALCPGEPDSNLFPRTEWARALATSARATTSRLGYRYDAGDLSLREAISRYLARWRSLAVDPARILITASTRQSLVVAGCLYADEGDSAWVESPGYSGASDAWRMAGLRLHSLAVDEQGLVCPPALAPARLLYTTPCFQYPVGHSLAPSRRAQLLSLAAASQTVIFEDDYDSEFRDDSQPRPALAGEENPTSATVLHAGTFSKLMFPAVRLGWMVVPEPHVASAVGVLRSLGGGHNTVQQRAVAELLDNGTVARHLVRARVEYGKRRKALLQALEGSPLQVRHRSGGLSLVIDLPVAVPGEALSSALRKLGLGAQPLEELSLTRKPDQLCRAVVVGTGTVDTASVAGSVAALISAWRDAQSAA